MKYQWFSNGSYAILHPDNTSTLIQPLQPETNGAIIGYLANLEAVLFVAAIIILFILHKKRWF